MEIISKQNVQRIRALLHFIMIDIDKATVPNPQGNLNRAAAQRARVYSIELEQCFKKYRKESVANENENKKRFKKYPETPSLPYPKSKKTMKVKTLVKDIHRGKPMEYNESFDL